MYDPGGFADVAKHLTYLPTYLCMYVCTCLGLNMSSFCSNRLWGFVETAVAGCMACEARRVR